MSILRPTIRRALVSAVAATGLALAATAAPAGAWGERTAYRTCGANWIESWPTSTGGKANTIKLSGSCTGRLQVGLRRADGLVIWVQGSNSYAGIEAAGTWSGGVHRGCYECGTSST